MKEKFRITHMNKKPGYIRAPWKKHKRRLNKRLRRMALDQLMSGGEYRKVNWTQRNLV